MVQRKCFLFNFCSALETGPVEVTASGTRRGQVRKVGCSGSAGDWRRNFTTDAPQQAAREIQKPPAHLKSSSPEKCINTPSPRMEKHK